MSYLDKPVVSKGNNVPEFFVEKQEGSHWVKCSDSFSCIGPAVDYLRDTPQAGVFRLAYYYRLVKQTHGNFHKAEQRSFPVLVPAQKIAGYVSQSKHI